MPNEMNDRSLTADERVFVRRRMREELLVVAAVQLFIPLVLLIGTLTTWTLFGLVSSLALLVDAAAVFALYEAFWIVRAARRWLRLRRDLHSDVAQSRKGDGPLGPGRVRRRR